MSSGGIRFPQGPSIRVTGVINPDFAIRETSGEDNQVARVLEFTRKSPVCIVHKPCSTQKGIIRRYRREFQPIFDRFETLFPTTELRIYWPTRRHSGPSSRPACRT